jgi:P-type Cu2+ transporter
VSTRGRSAPEAAVLHVGGPHYASEKVVVEQVLTRRPGVISVEANPVAQRATVASTLMSRGLRRCASGSSIAAITAPASRHRDRSAIHWSRPATARTTTRQPATADAADGCGRGAHARMLMASAVAEMRNHYLFFLIFTILIVLWSGGGSGLSGSNLAAPLHEGAPAR